MSKLKAPTLKNVARYLHRYLGLAVGAPVFVFCASACVLLVRPEVERFLEPERYYAESPDGERLPLDVLLERLVATEKAELGDADVVATRAQIPCDRRLNYCVHLAADDGEDAWNYVVYVDPYTAEPRAWGASESTPFWGATKRFHRFLGLGPEYGVPIGGAATLLSLLVVLTGLVRWYPLKRGGKRTWDDWKRGLTPTLNKGATRAVFDLHNVVGFYVAASFFLLAASGVWESYRWARSAFAAVVDVSEPENAIETPTPGPAKLTLQEILERQNDAAPERGDLDFWFPSEGEAAYFRKGGGTFFAGPAKDGYYWDAATGELLGVEKYSARPWGARAWDAVTPLHTGEIFGTASRWFFFVVCLGTCVVCATGYWWTLIRWRNKRRAKSAKRGAASSEKDAETEGKAA